MCVASYFPSIQLIHEIIRSTAIRYAAPKHKHFNPIMVTRTRTANRDVSSIPLELTSYTTRCEKRPLSYAASNGNCRRLTSYKQLSTSTGAVYSARD